MRSAISWESQASKLTAIPRLSEFEVQDFGGHAFVDFIKVIRFQNMAESMDDDGVKPPEETLAIKTTGFFWTTLLITTTEVFSLFFGFKQQCDAFHSKRCCEYITDGNVKGCQP